MPADAVERRGSAAPRTRVVFALVFSAVLCGGFYLAFGDLGLYLGDEGYLWYGVKRTVAGEVPLRDFQAYDPGRYFWCAAFAPFLGDGILGLRAATTAFQALGLGVALLVASRFVRSFAGLAFSGVLLWLWMFPNHKLFEPALASMATWFAVRLIERPSAARHLAAGVYAGMAGFFGRNHALYAAVALGLLLLFLAWKERERGWFRRVGLWALGGVVGFAPMWAMFLFVPGFAAAFAQSTRIFLKHGTNVPVPYPWPWRTDWESLGGWDFAATAAITAAFLLPCIVLPIGVIRAIRLPRAALRENAATVAAAFVGALYIHHVAVRSHPHHLAECLPPLLLLALGLSAGKGFCGTVWGGLALVTVMSVLEVHPTLSRFRPGHEEPKVVEYEVAGDALRVNADHALYLWTLETFVASHIAPSEPLFIAPNRPTLYSVLGKVSPTWWIYFFWPATDEEQRELIERLNARGVDWALIFDRPIDEREELRFRNTHPIVWAFLMTRFEPVGGLDLPEENYLLRRR